MILSLKKQMILHALTKKTKEEKTPVMAIPKKIYLMRVQSPYERFEFQNTTSR